jgi:hypothetical protein
MIIQDNQYIMLGNTLINVNSIYSITPTPIYTYRIKTINDNNSSISFFDENNTALIITATISIKTKFDTFTYQYTIPRINLDQAHNTKFFNTTFTQYKDFLTPIFNILNIPYNSTTLEPNEWYNNKY